jgi:uncharacterized Zn finger protein (UPF0148 family)
MDEDVICPTCGQIVVPSGIAWTVSNDDMEKPVEIQEQVDAITERVDKALETFNATSKFKLQAGEYDISDEDTAPGKPVGSVLFKIDGLDFGKFFVVEYVDKALQAFNATSKFKLDEDAVGSIMFQVDGLAIAKFFAALDVKY